MGAFADNEGGQAGENNGLRPNHQSPDGPSGSGHRASPPDLHCLTNLHEESPAAHCNTESDRMTFLQSLSNNGHYQTMLDRFRDMSVILTSTTMDLY
jgi:hypothetical protein